jgi:hypothetical protein
MTTSVDKIIIIVNTIPIFPERMATPIRTTILNIVMNPYDGKRPKKPEKVYDMGQVFDTLRARSFPVVLKPGINNNKQVENITIQSVYACLPGGRGCVGKERMGTKLQDRQIAMVYDKGYLKNPSHKNKPIGFLQMLGTIAYKDGTVSNISIPVESSGVVGVRAGGMTVDPTARRNSDNAVRSVIAEIETIVFKLLKFKKVRDSKIVMINGTFNLFSNVAEKKNRPRVSNFAAFLDAIHKGGLNKHFKKPTMPWQNRQGAPSVVKSVFKSETLPTLMITPLGHCEVMGASSFGDIVKVYEILSESYANIKKSVVLLQPVTAENGTNKVVYKLDKNGKLVSTGITRKYQKKERVNVSVLNSNLAKTANGKLLIKKKPCISYKKHVIKNIAERKGLVTRGTRADLCERLVGLL